MTCWPRTRLGAVRLSAVPDLRYYYGSLGDEINNLVVPSARLVWRF